MTESDSYSGACTTIADGNHYPTYVVSKEIAETDNVDVYDGKEYNTYETTATNGLLTAVDTLTDTEKMYLGTARPTFMTLAPNSITKIRVYVYIEGQDVDNYDFASLGKQIKVEFGFTKEKFYGEDVNYDNDPELPADLYRYDYVEYTTENAVTELPAGVTYTAGADGEAGQIKVLKANNYTTFEFKDGETVKVATLSETGTGEEKVRTWTITDKQ